MVGLDTWGARTFMKFGVRDKNHFSIILFAKMLLIARISQFLIKKFHT